MKLYIGNCQDKFDCENLISECLQHNVQPSHGHMELDSNNQFYKDYVEQTNMLAAAGYDEKTVEYRHYKSGEHFDKFYTEQLGKLVSAIPIMCWVSEIRPGKCTPWHWDINPWEEEHKKLGKLVRYFCFLSKPQPGHIFVTEYDAYYNEPQGAIYQYENLHSWHAGTNCGIVPKFLLTLTAYQ
jgi:hypothetical protein